MNRIDNFIVDCPSFEDFRKRTSALPIPKDRGDAFERLAQVYLQTEPEYQTKLKNVWLLDEVPAGVRNEIGLPRKDIGIDLIARDINGAHWAIQCKFRANNEDAVSWDDVSTFNALVAGLRNISQKVIAHTSARPVGWRELMHNLVEVDLDDFRQADWLLIQQAIRDNAPTHPTPSNPTGRFAWQQLVIDAAVEHFRANERGRAQLPCGTGKSKIAYFIANALEAKTMIVAVPSLNLVKQTVKVWIREEVARGRKPEWLCVGSDDTVNDVDDITDEGPDVGLPTTTDENVIAEWLPQSGVRKIVFTTYQSSDKLAAATEKVGITFDLVVLDEAHRTTGDPNRDFATLLHDHKLKARRRLFMTATERKISSRDDRQLFSMDDDAADYGARFYTMSFKTAIEQGIITDYQIVTYFVKESEIEQLINENKLLTVDPALDPVAARDVATAVATKRVIERYGVKHALVFNRSIKASKRFRDQQDLLNKSAIGPVSANFHVDSAMSAAERADWLAEFIEAPVAIMSNARCLTEGVDVPSIDAVVFATPKQSTVDIVQASGRALRRAPGKNFGYIVIPIIVPDDMSFAEFAESTQFKTILKILTAMSTQDGRIVETLRARFNGPNPKGSKPSERIIEIGTDVPVGFKIPLDEFASYIEAILWERVARVNPRPFEEAREYARSLGLKSYTEWRDFSKSEKKPADIPADPYLVYREKWVSFYDWLGNEQPAPPLPFEEAREYVRSFALRDQQEWREFSRSGKRPEEIPAAPDRVYAGKGWVNWGDWLGTGRVANQNRIYRPFEEAREYARSLGLKTWKKWTEFAKLGKLPVDIPANPRAVYDGKGWINWGDWLGTGRVANQDRIYRPFEEAREYARSLGLKDQQEWIEFSRSGRRPEDVPAAPNRAYAGKGWKGWGDWLGTGRVANQDRIYRPFEEAREYARLLGLKNHDEWREFSRSEERPADIPASPDQVYAGKGWKGWGDWLGTGRVANQDRIYRPFEEAREYARSLGLKSQREWREFIKSGKLPADIPVTPDRTYAGKGWINWGDWLGTGRIADQDRIYRPFEEAREYARSLGLKSQREWREFIKSGKLPADIPANPAQTYAGKGWINWGDWLGTGRIADQDRIYRPFEEAREHARSLGLKSRQEWAELSRLGKLPTDIPANPAQTYAGKGWKGWGDWLGTGRVANQDRIFRPLEEAREHARSLGLKSKEEWRAVARLGKLRDDIPVNPDQFYAGKGWISWGDWLGTGRVADQYRIYRPFEEAREHARSLGLKSRQEWVELSRLGKLPADIPGNPNRTYAGKGWKGWGDWLGTGRVAPKDRIFARARKHVSMRYHLGLRAVRGGHDQRSRGRGRRRATVRSTASRRHRGRGQGCGRRAAMTSNSVLCATPRVR
jgi:superfamily II DNA or RNA helicase